MEISVFLNYDAYKANKAVFRRAVLCPDVMDYTSAVRVFKSIFGEKSIVEFIVL